MSRWSADISERAGENVLKIVQENKKTAELDQEISVVARGQGSGTAPNNDSIHDLDAVVQQASVSAEEMAAASGELSIQTEEQSDMMGFSSQVSQTTRLNADTIRYQVECTK